MSQLQLTTGRFFPDIACNSIFKVAEGIWNWSCCGGWLFTYYASYYIIILQYNQLPSRSNDKYDSYLTPPYHHHHHHNNSFPKGTGSKLGYLLRQTDRETERQTETPRSNSSSSSLFLLPCLAFLFFSPSSLESLVLYGKFNDSSGLYTDYS